MKLSETQKQIISLMREGWELGASHTFTGWAWMQKDGLGKGGESRNVKSNTFFALIKLNLISCPERHFPHSKYELTELGKTVKL